MLAALAAGGERPRLVHRLDRDTSGLLVVARTAAAAAKLTAAFRRHQVGKLYWALVVGRPPAAQGRIDRPLAKQPGRGGERVAASEDGLAARTEYRVVARAGKVACWLALKPLTGRTHQLRAHCALLGTPIIGDGKYGGAAAHPPGAPKGLMLHAREIRLPHPDGGVLELTAPLSETVLAGFALARLRARPEPAGRPACRFRSAMTRLIVFDCDGTLVDSQQLIVEAARRTLLAHGLEPLAAGADPRGDRPVARSGVREARAGRRCADAREPGRDLSDRLAGAARARGARAAVSRAPGGAAARWTAGAICLASRPGSRGPG